MSGVMETTVGWSLILLVATTCAVMIYFVFMLMKLMHWMGKTKGRIRIIRKVQAQETKASALAPVQEEIMEMEPVVIRRGPSVHKVFWIGVAIAYALAILLIFWYFVFILLVLVLVAKVSRKFSMKKA